MIKIKGDDNMSFIQQFKNCDLNSLFERISKIVDSSKDISECHMRTRIEDINNIKKAKTILDINLYSIVDRKTNNGNMSVSSLVTLWNPNWHPNLNKNYVKTKFADNRIKSVDVFDRLMNEIKKSLTDSIENENVIINIICNFDINMKNYKYVLNKWDKYHYEFSATYNFKE